MLLMVVAPGLCIDNAVLAGNFSCTTPGISRARIQLVVFPNRGRTVNMLFERNVVHEDAP